MTCPLGARAKRGKGSRGIHSARINSRTSSDVVFDANLGDLISIRIAGNIVNNEIVGSLELSIREIGTKLIIVKGHANFGAVNAAIHSLQGSHIEHITSKIKPSVVEAMQAHDGDGSGTSLLEASCRLNVQN